MWPRFYAPGAVSGATLVDLPADEARHLTRVLRLGPGAGVILFDGAGHAFTGRVDETSRAGARVRIVAPCESAPEPAVSLTLVQGVLKGDHMDGVVRDAVMMGVAAIHPVGTAHGQVRSRTLSRGGGAARWRRVAIASAKQCRRAVVPSVLPVRAFRDVVSEAPAADQCRILLVEPAAARVPVSGVPRFADGPAPRSAVLAVGPEGGWSAAELEAAVAHGWLPLTLGHRTLRADAVPVAAIAVLQFCWKDL